MERLGAFGKVSMCKRVFKEQTQPKGDIPFFKIGTFGKNPDAFISTALYEEFRSKYSYPKVGDILISAAGTIGRTVVFDGTPAYFQDSNIVWIDNDEHEVLNRFLLFCYENTRWTTENTTIARLYNDNLKQISVSLPTLPEQRKIADFLTAVDGRIGQLIQKKALLEDYKKGVMQQLFTQAIRFKDKVNGEAREGALGCDHGNDFPDWEEKPFYELLDDVLDFRGRTPLKLGMDWGGGEVKSLSANNVKNGYIDFSAECNLGSEALYDRWMGGINLEKGDIVFTMEAPLGKALQIPDEQKYILSQRVVVFKTKKQVIDSFLLQLIWSAAFQAQLSRLATGSTAKGINQRSLKKVVVPLPTSYEQTKIADFLSALDRKIESVATQITETQTFKRGLLQQMFV